MYYYTDNCVQRYKIIKKNADMGVGKLLITDCEYVCGVLQNGCVFCADFTCRNSVIVPI